MKLIVGLGNYGLKYKNTRHNVGYMVLDEYAKLNNLEFNKSKFSGVYTEITKENEKIIFLKPEKYVNLSGEVVRSFIDYFKINLEDVLVIHDDLDLELGEYKLKQDGGSAGHNGVTNIILNLASKEFKRLKIGISKSDQISTSNYVLGKFSKEEEEKIEQVITTAINIINDYIDEDFIKIMNKYN